MQPSLHLHPWGLRTEEIEDMDMERVLLTMVAMPRSDFRSSSSWSSLLLTSRRKHGTSSWTRWMLLHTKLAVLDYYFSTQRKFFHQMNFALALGCLRLSELPSIPSHVMGMLLAIAAAHAYLLPFIQIRPPLGENGEPLCCRSGQEWATQVVELLVSRIIKLSICILTYLYVMY